MRVAVQLINERPEVVQLMMAVFIPLKAEIFPQGWVEYIGICEHFEEREEGFLTPQYDFVIMRNSDGTHSIKEIRKV